MFPHTKSFAFPSPMNWLWPTSRIAQRRLTARVADVSKIKHKKYSVFVYLFLIRICQIKKVVKAYFFNLKKLNYNFLLRRSTSVHAAPERDRRACHLAAARHDRERAAPGDDVRRCHRARGDADRARLRARGGGPVRPYPGLKMGTDRVPPRRRNPDSARPAALCTVLGRCNHRPL